MEWQQLLNFWFGELSNGIAAADKQQRWFTVDPAFDTLCSQRFGPLLALAAAGDLNDWTSTPAGRLAFIILCDQIPRNVYRGRSDAFAWDEYAIAAAQEGVALQVDQQLAWDERSFFYLPFEHSEDLIHQQISVGLFSELRDQAPGPLKERMGNSLRYAQRHRDVIRRFGRFPHRNAALKRHSTDHEKTYLAEGGGF